MKILLINDFKTKKGGVENYLFELVSANTEFKFKLYGKENEPNFVKKFYNFETKSEIIQIIDEFKPDIIHAFNIGKIITPSFMVYAKKCKIPIILSFRDYHYICPKRYMLNDDNEIISECNSFYNCVFHHLPKRNIIYDTPKYLKTKFHSYYFRKYISYFLTPSDDLTNKILVKYPNLKGETLANPTMLELCQESKYENREDILYVGRLSKEKGILTLIKSFVELNVDENLFIVGDGPQKDELLNYICTRGLKKIKLLGLMDRPKLAKIYSQVRFTVVPSEWMESYGNVVLESFAFKTPVIVSNLGGIEYNVMKSNGGLIFERGDVIDLKIKMEKLFNNVSLSRKLGINGFAFAETLTMKDHLNRLKEIYSNFDGSVKSFY